MPLEAMSVSVVTLMALVITWALVSRRNSNFWQIRQAFDSVSFNEQALLSALRLLACVQLAQLL